MLSVKLEGYQLALITPDPEDAEAFWGWAEDHLQSNVMDGDELDDATPWQTWGDALVVETHYLQLILRALRETGFDLTWRD